MNDIATIIQICFYIIPIITSILTLQYLGMTFDENIEIKSDDWRRKWIIFFAWLNLVMTLLMIVLVLIIIIKKMK